MRRRRTATNESAEAASSGAPAPEAAGRRRGRRPATTEAEGTGSAPSRTRTTRRRRAQPGSETGRLIDALLRSRGARGATQAEVAQVVNWAQNILSEGAALVVESSELRKLGPRGKRSTPVAAARQKQQKEQRLQEIAARQQRHTMDRALLDGVLAGSISLDVKDGELVFLSGQYAAEHAGGSAAEEAL